MPAYRFAALIAQVLRHEAEVNGLERRIDEFTGQIIARRQPAARDLRLLMALLGATTDLKRVGDESKKIAKSLERIGGHAKNISEHTVYAAMGRDVRHASVQELERLVQR